MPTIVTRFDFTGIRYAQAIRHRDRSGQKEKRDRLKNRKLKDFWNEFRSDGTSGTAASALIEGLQTHNAGEVAAAAEQLAANSADVAGNNRMADGGNYDAVVAAAQATAVTPTGGGAGGGRPRDSHEDRLQ